MGRNAGKLSGHKYKGRAAMWCGSSGWKNLFKYSCPLEGRMSLLRGGETLEAADSIFRDCSPQTQAI